MADDNNNLVMEETKLESMLPPTNHSRSFLRTAHFLTPSIKNDAVPAPPPCFNASNYKDLPFHVNFRNLKYPTRKWATWIRKMQALHHLTWKKAGIFDAIISSTSKIIRNESLIYGFFEKWCPVTNTFVFPWGEATVTLEDMIVLGGYSVLGDSVLIPPNKEACTKMKKMMKERSKITNTKVRKADHSAWMNRFMGSGSEIEHEAFLAYWLSRFVFPMNAIDKRVLSIAVHLSVGIKIVLAPTVLARIYQSLSLLKATITAAKIMGNRGECQDVLEITVSAPLGLVQVWIWERFLSLRPKPNCIKPNEPRIARWHKLKKVEVLDLSLTGDNFEWRPYTKDMESSFHRKIYADNEYWEMVDTGLNKDLEELIRCLRTSQLVGLEADCIEQYLPHRVAMQFGMDQDVPGCVRENGSPGIAWGNYIRPRIDEKVYVSPLLVEPGVTTKYMKWWKTSFYEDSKVKVTDDDDN